MRRSGLAFLGVGILVAMAIAIVVLSAGSVPVPFDANSSAPDGYRAIRILLQDAGAEVVSVSLDEAASRSFGPQDALVVPVAAFAGADQLEAFRSATRAGSTLVMADDESFFQWDRQTLVRTPAIPLARGACDIAVLQDLEVIDDLGGSTLDIVGAESVCFADGEGAAVVQETEGEGTITTLSSPYLWSNARLQPDKEDGGVPLDNGPMAVALLGGADTVTFVDAEAPPGVTAEGTRNPISLLPVPVRLGIAQALGAFLVYAWWRSRRLGRVVGEPLPVEVAGSELVEAVGGLLRRNGSATLVARVLRN